MHQRDAGPTPWHQLEAGHHPWQHNTACTVIANSICGRVSFTHFGTSSAAPIGVAKEPFSFGTSFSTELTSVAKDYSRHYAAGGLKWTRTTDLTLIRRAL